MSLTFYSNLYRKPIRSAFNTLKLPGTCIATTVLFYYYWTYIQVEDLSVPYPTALLPFNTSQKYLSSNLASFCQLGNNIFELAALYGIAKRLRRIPVFFIENGHHKKMLEKTTKVIPGLMKNFIVIEGSVPENIPRTKFHGKCCTYEDPKVLKHVQDEYLHLSRIHYQSWKYFPNMRDTFRSFLKSPGSVDFRNLPESDDNIHVTCVHTRRGDFVTVNFYSSDANFIKSSLLYIDQREKMNDFRMNRKTVIFGDDEVFMKSIFKDSAPSHLVYISKNSPYDDIVYSKFNCDVVLISAPRSTFGFWMGYFSKGDRVYYLDTKYAKDFVTESGNFRAKDFFLPHWIPMKFSNQKVTVINNR